ncbi:MAG: FMN-binding protein [Bacillota bacterium]|nr:FMN-binding protein [Bacillota bacterium]
MKKIILALLVVVSLVALAGCAPKQPEQTYENGTYRGTFSDSGEMQVNVEFKLENNIVKSIKFRYLAYKGVDYLKSDDQTVIGLRDQHQQLADHLIGKDIRVALADLYKPGDIVKNQVDAFTGATLRASKVLSASRDALNRGVYSR